MDAMLWKFIYSITIGVLIAVPIGPISIMCVKYSLKQSFIAGLIVGLGAGIGDIIYAIIAGIGLEVVTNSVSGSAGIFKIFGGIFLVLISIKALYTERYVKLDLNTENKQDSNQYIFTAAFLTNIFNPITVILFISLFSGANITLNEPIEFILVPLGVFIGSVGWMVLMALFIHRIKHKITKKTAHYINFFSNLLMMGFGLISFYNGLEVLWLK